MTYTHVFLSSSPPQPPTKVYFARLKHGLRPETPDLGKHNLPTGWSCRCCRIFTRLSKCQVSEYSRTPGRCRRWAGVMVRCSTDCGTRKKSTSSSRITFRHSLSRTRVRHFVSLLPAFRFNPVLSFPLTKWKQVQIWRALCLKSNHHSTRLLDSQGNLTTYKAARYNYIYICCHFTDTTTCTLSRDTQKLVCYFWIQWTGIIWKC